MRSLANHPVNHIGVTVPDIYAAIDWYRDVGLELFQFVDPPVAEAEDEAGYWRQGYWHLCLTVEDLPRTTLELMSHPYEEVFRDCPQAGMTAAPTWLLRDGGTRPGGRQPG